MIRDQKMEVLEEILRSLGKVVVAFSGGVDSTFLTAAALRFLGPEQVVAMTAVSATLTAEERESASELARFLGAKHLLIETAEFSDPAFIANTPDRCYHCKKVRFQALVAWASARGIPWVVEGSNVDDQSDYRPGRRAIAELGSVRSPLEEAGLTKADIRALSKEWGLPTWAKSSDACSATRIAYGLELTPERLRQVERAEKMVRPFCKGSLRVRHHGSLARIEVSAENISKLAEPETAQKIASKLRELGFHHVALDLSGYRMGSLNADLD